MFCLQEYIGIELPNLIVIFMLGEICYPIRFRRLLVPFSTAGPGEKGVKKLYKRQTLSL
jgi:hypothetical protein